MSVYCGTDIIEVARIKKSMQKSIFKVSIYTDFEIEDIDNIKHYLHYVNVKTMHHHLKILKLQMMSL